MLLSTTVSTDEVTTALSEIAEQFVGMSPGEVFEKYRWPALTAIVLLVAGYFLIKALVGLADRALKHSRVDISAHAMICAALRTVLYILLVLLAASVMGVPLSSSLAMFSVFALAISLALKDSLAQIASGIMILASHPFSVGDLVECTADTVQGVVEEIWLVHTRLKTFDNKGVYIPNSVLINSTVINYTGAGRRRLDLVFRIGYEDDFEKAVELVRRLVEAHPLAEQEPGPVVRVKELTESGVEIICRVWVEKGDYESLRFDLLEGVKKAFDAAGIHIPYQKLEVRMTNS